MASHRLYSLTEYTDSKREGKCHHLSLFPEVRFDMSTLLLAYAFSDIPPLLGWMVPSTAVRAEILYSSIDSNAKLFPQTYSEITFNSYMDIP